MKAYATSAELAQELGTFPAYERNKQGMLRVLRNHHRVAFDSPENEYESLSSKPLRFSPEDYPPYLREAMQQEADQALALGEKHGYP